MAAGATSSAEHQGSVQVRREGDVAVVTLCRERKRNALSTHMETELLRALRTDEVTSSRAVVVTGGDTVFSAGADVTELRDMSPAAIARYYRESGSVYEVFAALPQPTVAAITGYCLGGGLELSLAADIRVADPAAVFGFPEVGIGILPSSGGVTRATRILGPGRSRDLILRGRRIDAAVAEAWGLVTEIAPAGEHVATALTVAAELARFHPMTMSVTKQVLDASVDASRSASLVLEQLAYALLNNTAGHGAEPSPGEAR
ncbi:enoyl-CoA hydratase [Mycolicibacterium mageritense DSM 44476 = CIP 104973]|uniref:Probable enoyl-CoA hydratase EchA17 n=1 Tax=Mycolicibacterium mageritense TaxID=53462 RepID=A0AAI8TVE7_MYCME|nr:enoyl-CoA hydratase/isomerase family protein [Mycolicibacterium mageritense]MBN3457827.1 enoyl-CoA hydratase/isomerase family protein [Mycobacterium sp. DSM 3803]OKH83023.1 crotonase [Mycobacterium sp. SWH-M3]MCC9182046.1 enoyl-CoA hydratase/isomerase family protein [Mycolicibacterium mageritense]TXI57793.1 MAG: enoyl-CoA hydratase/isomerase family protein [Mycolicibacterium mageritense]CDO23393.1 enoyl-CoA hydratase [Mycolicibacterium mageritense DSM 44476 = CIP 104973]